MVFTLRHRRHAGGWYTKDRSLAPFVCPPAFVHFTIVICVSRDCMKITYTSCHAKWPITLFWLVFSCVLFYSLREMCCYFMTFGLLLLYTLVPAARLFSRAACLAISLGTGVSKSCSRRISFWDWGEYDDFSRVVGLVAAFGARLEIIFAHILAFPARAIRGAAYQWKFSYYCLNTSPWQWMTTAC